MKIFKSSQVKEIDAYTIKNEPIESIDLMERAATQLAGWITQKHNNSNFFKIFIGPGNNGGDGLALSRLLAEKGYHVEVYILKLKEFNGNPLINLNRLKNQGKAKIKFIESENNFPKINENEIIVDALFGSGLDRPLKEMPAKIVNLINQLPNTVIAVDVPSGLFGEDNSGNIGQNIIQANYTLSFQFPNLSFLFPENEKYTGKWHILPIGLHEKIINELVTNWNLIDQSIIMSVHKERATFSHKGTYGHGLLISGSYGKMGAAVLASKACLRTGIGLLTTHVPKKGYEIIQTTTPETMVSIDVSDELFTKMPELKLYNAIGIGPGIGTFNKTAIVFKELLKKINSPLVIDADGLNILSENKDWLKMLPPDTILTPHPKEFERLFGKTKNSYKQHELQREMSQKLGIYIVCKGAYTHISTPEGHSYYNSTGNPGMATAGSGDVLTGIILSLLAQGYIPKYAAVLGVYLHGFAGDIAAKKKGQEALIASDIIENIGKAYKKNLI